MPVDYSPLCMLQPKIHIHIAVHRGGHCEVLLRLQSLTGAAGELAEPEVAVGDEGAHAARLGEGQGLRGSAHFSQPRARCSACDVTLAACRHGGLSELGDAGLTEQEGMARTSRGRVKGGSNG